MRLQGCDESVQSACGMADGEERGHGLIGCQRRWRGLDQAPLFWDTKAIRRNASNGICARSPGHHTGSNWNASDLPECLRGLGLRDLLPGCIHEHTRGWEIASQSRPDGLQRQRRERVWDHLPVCKRDTGPRASFHFRAPGIGLIVEGFLCFGIKAVCCTIKNFEVVRIDEGTLALFQVAAYGPFDNCRAGTLRSCQTVHGKQDIL